MIKDYNSEIPKYKKKSHYKAKKRSDHKHIYKYVRILVPFTNPYTQKIEYHNGLAQVCEKCGYIHWYYTLLSENSKEDMLWQQCDERAYVCNFNDKFIDLNI